MERQLTPVPRESEWLASLELLRRGEYELGWLLWERRPIHMGGRDPGKPQMPFPEWDGRPIKSLLILPEQGLGDQIMFARYVPALRAMGIDVHVMCHPLLVRLFAHLDVPVHNAQGRVLLPKVDAWVMGPSLPYLCRTTPQNVPTPKLFPSVSEGLGIGLAAAGNPGHPNDRNRSLPMEVAASMTAWPGVVSLDPKATGSRDLEETREIIGGLSLVISIDSVVAHLALSMGKPCWVLLPFTGLDWRWADGIASPWYPSAKLFRQERHGDWSKVLFEVQRNLKQI